MKQLSVPGFSLALLVTCLCFAQTSTVPKDPGHVMLTPNEVQWQTGPPEFPSGSQVAVLDGDPSQPGRAYTIGLKMLDGYKIPPHWHPVDASVAVMQGVFGVGIGEKADPSRGRELPAGSYMRMSKGVRHFEWTKGETIIYISGLGPLGTTYVNPADDPRQKSTSK